MTTVVTLFLVSLVASATFTPLARDLAIRYGLIDNPDGRRKVHTAPIPVSGGLAVFAACITALLIAFVFDNPLRAHLHANVKVLLGLFLASGIICAMGVLDDYVRIRGRHKLLGQLLAVGVILSFGPVVKHVQVFHWNIDLGLLAIPFTVFWLLGAMNSLNFIDGMDGMLATVGAIISLAMAAIAVIGQHWTGACLAVALAGSLLGFLRYNFPPASIFLGNSGSMFIGLVIGVMAIQSSLKGPATVALAAPLALLTIPIFDTLVAILRRKLTGRSIYSTDRGHLHHVLLRRGFSGRLVLLCVSFLCLATVAGALTSLALKNEIYAILSALAVVSMLVVTRLFGYAEFLLLKNRLFQTAASLFKKEKQEPLKSIVRLQGSADWKDIWETLVDCAIQLHLQRIRLDVNVPVIHEGYHAEWDQGVEDRGEFTEFWRAEIPLRVYGQTVGRLELAGRRDDEPVWQVIAFMTPAIEKVEAGIAALIGGADADFLAEAFHEARMVEAGAAAGTGGRSL